jgi:mRNA-degrading endonuclease RelE of RelBE toxin-antitoxin system
MKHVTAARFWKSFNDLPIDIQKIAREKFALFSENPHHPSLRTKKREGNDEIWEGHISLGYVFTFRYAIRENERVIESLDIGKHDVVYNRI